MLEYLRVNIDPGHSRVDRGCPQVEQARSAGPDKDDPALDLFLRNFPGQHLPGGNICCLVEVAELEIHPSRTIRGHFDVADADVVEAGGLPESRLATRVRCLKHVGCCSLGNAKRFRCERRHESLIKPEHEGDTANNLIAIGHPVERADSACRILELWQGFGWPH